MIIGSFSFGAAAAVLSMCDPSFNSPSFQHTENNQFKLYIVTFQEQKIVERCFEDFNSSILKLLAPTVTGYIEKKLKKKIEKTNRFHVCLFRRHCARPKVLKSDWRIRFDIQNNSFNLKCFSQLKIHCVELMVGNGIIISLCYSLKKIKLNGQRTFCIEKNSRY